MERVLLVNGTFYEPSCEAGVCTADMLSFKGYVHQCRRVMALLRSSARPLSNSVQAATTTANAAPIRRRYRRLRRQRREKAGAEIQDATAHLRLLCRFTTRLLRSDNH
ncbi:hypothetical protein GGR54DRAFT_498123 [Hypoxylon sp. NC1633]|nr:hypothetical protein GGR54DRAFT_498123 [Hypoxylon sp. NC1633]